MRHAELLANGIGWVPRGVEIVGLVAPNSSLRPKFARAHAHFGARELRAVVRAHADTVRFQVSEFGLDPDGPLSSSAYLREVVAAVKQARAMGLAAIISLQAESPAGEPSRCPLSDMGAERAWERLARIFAADRGVLFELYNEPALTPSSAAWALWQSGGPVSYGGVTCSAVGMQTLINAIRAMHADNVLIVPGLDYQKTLAGHPALIDPASPADPQLVYGAHFPGLRKPSTVWDQEFGFQTRTAPVIISAWFFNSDGPWCPPDPAQNTLRLLSYLQGKRIGIVGYSFDLPGTITRDWTYAPTTLGNFKCGVSGDGPGQLLFDEFAGVRY